MVALVLLHRSGCCGVAPGHGLLSGDLHRNCATVANAEMGAAVRNGPGSDLSGGPALPKRGPSLRMPSGSSRGPAVWSRYRPLREPECTLDGDLVRLCRQHR